MLIGIESPALPPAMTGRPVHCACWQRPLFRIDGLRTQQAVGCETDPRVYGAVALAGLFAFWLLAGKRKKRGGTLALLRGAKR